MAIFLSKTTTIQKVGATTTAKKTTVPVDILELLGMGEGDKLRWDASIVDKKVVITVSKEIE